MMDAEDRAILQMMTGNHVSEYARLATRVRRACDDLEAAAAAKRLKRQKKITRYGKPTVRQQGDSLTAKASSFAPGVYSPLVAVESLPPLDPSVGGEPLKVTDVGQELKQAANALIAELEAEVGGECVKCHECQANGERSTVYIGPSSTTAAYSPPFYDSEGIKHFHDPNITTTPHSCSNGHRWSVERYGNCWCGWNRKHDLRSQE